ncbi:MAG TPA: XdhC family protein [Thermoanaerobaculia bacterium]|jgi:xanthine dehydrogenase accessory factor
MRSELYRRLAADLAQERLVALASVVEGPAAWRGRQLLLWPDGTVDGELRELAEQLGKPAREAFTTFRAQRLAVEHQGETLDVFLEVHPPRPKLVIVGAVHVAISLVSFAKTLGLRTYVVDPRTAFATPERFAHADELLTDWPDEALARIGLNESTYVALLSHDLKLDVPALKVALPSRARYVGALGSAKTHQKRLKALAEEGVPAALAARIHNPIGLDLGGRRAEEMAVAILAEIVAVSHGKGVKLRA